jgi:hypothetical protein
LLQIRSTPDLTDCNSTFSEIMPRSCNWQLSFKIGASGKTVAVISTKTKQVISDF